jgi:23S rRNA pseudouridine2605 synthase
MEKTRLQKYFTDCGIMSRRAAEREILAGRVKVNGKAAEIGQKIDPETDIVEYNGKRVAMPEARKKIYIMLNKPRGYLSSVSDDRGRHCVTELVSGCGARVYPVGRLDMDSEGLLLLTDDGDFDYRLTHPKHDIPKIYQVTLAGEISDDYLKKLAEPMELDGYMLAPVEVRLLSRDRNATVIEMTLREGRNRQIRRMCESVGLCITRLCRTAIGELPLGSLPSGRWRNLSDREVAYLYNNLQVKL